MSLKAGEFGVDAIQPIDPLVAVDAFGILHQPDSVYPLARATDRNITGKGALITSELEHRRGCDWLALAGLL